MVLGKKRGEINRIKYKLFKEASSQSTKWPSAESLTLVRESTPSGQYFEARIAWKSYTLESIATHSEIFNKINVLLYGVLNFPCRKPNLLSRHPDDVSCFVIDFSELRIWKPELASSPLTPLSMWMNKKKFSKQNMLNKISMRTTDLLHHAEIEDKMLQGRLAAEQIVALDEWKDWDNFWYRTKFGHKTYHFEAADLELQCLVALVHKKIVALHEWNA